jgi:phage-related protein
MSVPGESQLNIGLSFDGFGQLVKVQQVFAKTEQIVNGAIGTIKEYGVEFGKMAVKMAANYNTLEKIIFNAPEKIFEVSSKVVGGLHDLYVGFGKDIGRIETSLGKISPKLQQLFSPLAKHMTVPMTEFIQLMEKVQGVINMVAEKYAIYKKAVLEVRKAIFDVNDSFKQVQKTVPAALQVFQDPKRLFNPEQWTMAVFPAIDAIGQLKENSIKLLEKVADFPGIGKFGAKVESLVPVVGKFAKNIGTSMLEHINKFGDKLGSLASKGFNFLSKGLMTVIPQVWAFTTALLANPVTWIVVGVVALGAAIFLLWKNWDKVVTWFKKGFQWLKDTLAKAPNWVVGLIAVFMPFIGIPLLIIKNWGAIVNFMKGIGSAIGSFFSSLWGRIVKVFAPLSNFIGPIISSLWNKLVHLFTSVFNLAGSIISKVVMLPIRIITVIGIILISLLGKAFEKIGSMLASLWGKVVKVFQWIVGAIGVLIGFAWGKVVSVFNQVIGVVGSVLGSIWGKVVNVFNRIVGTIGAVLGSIFSRIADTIGQVIGSVWNRIVNVFTQITGFIGSVISSIFTSIAGFIGPVLASIWTQVVNVFTNIGNAIGSVFSSLWNAAISFIMNGVNFIGGIIGGILDFFNGIIDSIQSAFNAVWNGIESVFQSIGKMFENIVPSWAKGLFNWAINPGGNSPGKNAPNPNKLDQKITTNSASDKQAANQLNQSQNNRTVNTKNTKVDKIEINLTGGKNDQQTAKTVRNELVKFFGEQGAATVGG